MKANKFHLLILPLLSLPTPFMLNETLINFSFFTQ